MCCEERTFVYPALWDFCRSRNRRTTSLLWICSDDNRDPAQDWETRAGGPWEGTSLLLRRGFHPCAVASGGGRAANRV
ncbi:protein of unknown function [Azospirillum baldaniorum]|uniref:Uncharacterized protein n=1 Tax=Azospirillum baldaniorum TaxID=1064539 RepID=A0A9P1JPA1_9PROT|nr:protein of unknown function [Azospirillum baldaniorum]